MSVIGEDPPQAPRRASLRSDDPEIQKRTFLAAYSANGNIAASCKLTGVSRETFNRWKEADTDFLIAFGLAQKNAGDMLELEARRRATEGVRKLKFFKGEPIMIADPYGRTVTQSLENSKGEIVETEVPLMVPYEEYEYSDTLLMFLLRAAKPEMYGANPVPGDGPTTKTYVNITLAEFGSEPGPPAISADGGGPGSVEVVGGRSPDSGSGGNGQEPRLSGEGPFRL